MTTGSLTPMLRGALRHARIESRVQLTSWNLVSWLLVPIVGLIVMWFLRGQEVLGSDVTLAQLGVPGLLAMTLMTTGMMGAAGQLVTEREDGSLLRAKAVPHALPSHLLGNVAVIATITFVPMLVLVVATTLVYGDPTPQGIGGWLTFVGIGILGLLATLPAGAVLGALIRNQYSFGWLAMVIYASTAISGIFYPLGALPTWLQCVGQALPTYWIGLGLRSAFLPESAVLLEVGQSWRPGLMVLVLAAWSLAGLALAPKALSVMVRRQSGSQVAAARERVMAKGY